MEDEHTNTPSELPRFDGTQIKRMVAIALAGFVLLFLVGWIPKHLRAAAARADVAALTSLKPVVDVYKPRRASTAGDLALPGNAVAAQTTELFPRTSGYLKKLYVDIGDTVTAGQLLAEIDAPEVDAQLAQARATLGRSESDAELTRVTLERYRGVIRTGGVTQQQLDEKEAAYAQARAAVQEARANVDRLQVTQGFQKIVAPFAGTIVTRAFDVGTLLSPTDVGPGKELFRVDRVDVIRVFANVPQRYASGIVVGQAVEFEVGNFPDKKFRGQIARAAGALDASSRTLRIEANFENSGGDLRPGMYGILRIGLTQRAPLVIPTSAVIFDSDGVRVATVVADAIHFQSVTLGRDYGTEVEVVTGLTENDAVVSNPGLVLREGGQVEVRQAAAGSA